MWQTVDGIRSLQGHERALFLHGTCDLRDDLIDRDWDDTADTTTSVEIFERMTNGEKIFALAWVLSSLLDDSYPVHAVAWEEATIYSVFRHIDGKIQEEIANQNDGVFNDFTFRKLLGKTVGKRRIRHCDYSGYIDEAGDLILWDHDFENEAWFLDLPPHLLPMHHANLGIREEYYVTPLPLVTDVYVKQADALIRLLGGYPVHSQR